MTRTHRRAHHWQSPATPIPHIGRRDGVVNERDAMPRGFGWGSKRMAVLDQRSGEVRLEWDDMTGVKSDYHRAMRRGARIIIQDELDEMYEDDAEYSHAICDVSPCHLCVGMEEIYQEIEMAWDVYDEMCEELTDQASYDMYDYFNGYLPEPCVICGEYFCII